MDFRLCVRARDDARVGPIQLAAGMKEGLVMRVRACNAIGKSGYGPAAWVVAALAAFAVVAAGCGGSAQATPIPRPKGDVQVATYDYEIAMPSTLTPGVHTIGLINHGKMEHELVMFKTDLSDLHMPLKADGDVNEDSPLLTKFVDSGSGPAVDAYAVPPGHTETFKTDYLTPGHYVAVCNLPGHYKLGMSLNVTVK
jgi:plastocyanin